ncbi:hypothetical protein T11_12148 [Trichinella zimbabwensis]|uniref:Uncharacterized protein n=1 Tax=Trichinella zimbabwensis TaxID=268475 RepID=A0A0V1I870_9BILA|nr:hypothetical protein T11_12148 [Trichinella zimbabwensis]
MALTTPYPHIITDARFYRAKSRVPLIEMILVLRSVFYPLLSLKSSSGRAKGRYLFPNFLYVTIKCAFHGYWLPDNVGSNFFFTSNSSATEFPHLMLALVSLFILNCLDFCLDLHLCTWLVGAKWRRHLPELSASCIVDTPS